MLEIQFIGPPPYSVYIGHNILCEPTWFEKLRGVAARWICVSDTHIYPLLGGFLQNLLPDPAILVPPGEYYKTRETKAFIEDRLISYGCGRDTGLIALGGGVITDLVGFSAATFCRGIPVVYLPTSLLAMVDASIGAKTAVNTPAAKNMIGLTASPYAIFSDVRFLEKAPDEAYNEGVFEVIKHALIADPGLFDSLITHQNLWYARNSTYLVEMVATNVRIKAAIVAQDRDDWGIRSLLNYGHTLGHAIENASDYHISHGQAVALGLWMECYLSIQYAGLTEATFEKITAVLKSYGMQTAWLQGLDFNRVQTALYADKKCRKGVLHSVFIQDIGRPLETAGHYSFPLALKDVEATWDWALQQCSA